MPPRKDPDGSANQPRILKRKDPPQSSSSQNTNKGRAAKRVKPLDARSILTQNADAALKNRELDLQAFLKSREFEIKALEDGMQRSKNSRTQRAFQQVPRDLRRRTASHNVKKVPKRLHNRATREMKEDNTPTIDTSKRKPGSSRARIRAETAKRLGILAAKKRLQKSGTAPRGLETRVPRPKIRKNLLNDPPKPISKFRKRQIHKTWLPTHMWHAKRATMTEPKKPLWRFAVPITSTEKSYRPTHRSGGARGAVAWDMSYMSTIGLEGPVESLENVLKAVGILDPALWEGKGEKWMTGKRSWAGWLTRENKDKRVQIGPSTVIWCSSEQDSTNEAGHMAKKKSLRRVFVRVHPAVFLEAWTELLRLSKMQRPAVHVEDLRFEIGSISITGPGSTEALIGILHPYHQADAQESHAKAFSSLAGVTNPGSLPANSVLAFSIMDPRLRYPPRPTKLPNPNDEEANFALLEMLSTWPADESSPSSTLFDRNARFKATRLPAQKSINRRKGDAKPGGYPSIVPTDPPIPIMLLTSRTVSSAATQGTWTLLAPWKCILPIWYGLVHYPLSSGGNPRFGGLDELRQIHFEHGVPWFPADYPGTNAGFAWEAEEQNKRKAEWDRRPKGKRIEWDSLDLGAGRKGEIGRGWACDFERLCGVTPLLESTSATSTTQDTESSKAHPGKDNVQSPIQHLTKDTFTHLLSASDGELPQSSKVATVRITLINRGIATPCARIYRLPQALASKEPSTVSSPPATTRQEWLDLLPATSNSKSLPNPKSKAAKNVGRIPLNVPVPQRVRLLAQSLLQNPPLSYPAGKSGDGHPLVPGEEELIGFVTTGEFNLAEGKGVAIGTVAVAKVIEGLRGEKKKGSKEGRLCIVRNAGENIGRLARWEAV
jgi:ribonuclease P/MRP protein subunit POP1